MKLKLISIAALVAMSLSVTAFSNAATTRRRVTPVPTPTKPTLPGVPSIPGFPGSPGAPGYPSIPSLPPMPAPGQGGPTDEPGVPFPLSITLPFPWGNIEGVWKVMEKGISVLFSFKVQTDQNGHQYLQVLEIDSNNNTVLAEGVGISVENDKLVRAAMTARAMISNYMLFIGSYKNTSQYGGSSTKSVTVLTLRPFTALMGDQDVQVITTKISNTPYQNALTL